MKPLFNRTTFYLMMWLASFSAINAQIKAASEFESPILQVILILSALSYMALIHDVIIHYFNNRSVKE